MSLTHIPTSRATVVPNQSKRKPLGSVRKLIIKDAMVKTIENCSSCPLQSVDAYNTGKERTMVVKYMASQVIKVR